MYSLDFKGLFFLFSQNFSEHVPKNFHTCSTKDFRVTQQSIPTIESNNQYRLFKATINTDHTEKYRSFSSAFLRQLFRKQNEAKLLKKTFVFKLLRRTYAAPMYLLFNLSK